MQYVEPKWKGENKGHNSPGVLSHGTLYISGQLSVDPATRETAKGDARAHARQALKNLDTVLEAAGLSRSQVVQCRIYVVGIENWDAVNEVYAEFFGSHKPARVVVPVTELHFGCLVEIEAVAEVEP